MSYLMGIDIGTYESKGVLVDQTGKLLAQAAVPHRLEIPQRGWAEHDAEHTWWHDCKLISNALVQQAKDRHGIVAEEIAAVGISSIAPAVVPVDAGGRPLRKAILYGVDTRAEEQIRQLHQAIGEEKLFAISGQSLSSQSAGPKILWIREQEPEIYQQTARFLCGSGYIVCKLTGEYVIDRYTAASYSPLFDMTTLEWNREMVQYITEPDKLPRLAWSHEVVGTVTAKAAQETGLAAGTKVIAGTADALSESISVGAVHKGDLMLMYGSSTFFILVTELLPRTKTMWANLHAVPNLKTITGGTATAGSLTRWFVDHWREEKREGDAAEATTGKSLEQLYTEFSQLAEHSPPGANGLITLPYFSGERTPIHHASAKGMFFGLSLHHTKQDMYRSILEGISFSIRHNIDEIKSLKVPPSRIVAVGGGVKNRLWLQSVSDICQIRQVIPEVTIGACYGNAFLCGLGLGWFSDLAQMDQWVKIRREIEPSQDHEELYERYYRLYHRLYQQTKEAMDEL